MSMEVKVNMDDMSKFFEWFFIVSTSVDKDGLTSYDFVNKVVENGERDETGEVNGTHRFRMFVNDIEVDPMTAIAEMQNQFETLVNEKAEELIKTRVNDKIQSMYNSLDEIHQTILDKQSSIFKNTQNE